MSKTATSVAIVIGAAMIAAAILITNHWQVTYLHPEGPISYVVLRLNRWTGVMDICDIDPHTIQADKPLVGAQFSCKPIPTP